MTDLEQAKNDGIAVWDDVYRETDWTVVYRDRYPVTPGHLLFVPKYNSLTGLERSFVAAAAHGELMIKNGECDGYNIGLNSGTAAGQTVMYPHIHLIPRRNGDCEDPVGGVRGVIPGQANYRKPEYKNK